MQHHSNHRDDGYPLIKDSAIDASSIKFFVHHHADAIDDTAHQDGETTDVEERQAGEPAIAGVMAKIERRANGIPPLHAIGDDGTFRLTGRAGGVHDGLGSVKVNEGAQGNVAFRKVADYGFAAV